MALRLHKRKLMDEITRFCSSNCAPSFCPLACITVCNSNCSNPLFSETPPPPAPNYSLPDHPAKPQKVSLFLTIGLGFLATTFFLFSCYTIYKFYKGWRDSRRRLEAELQEDEIREDFFDQDLEPEIDHPIWYIRTVGLQSSVISAITICKYKRGDGLIEGTECSVCLSEFQEDETLRLLPKCSHAFHIPCIDTWLRSHTNCPMCRAGIVTNSTIVSQLPEQSVGSSGLLEESQIGISEEHVEPDREREDGDCELRVGNLGIEGEGQSQVKSGLKNTMEEMASSNLGKVDEVYPLRRSVSADSLSASTITAACPQKFDENQLVNGNGFIKAIIDVAQKGANANQRSLTLLGSSSIQKSLRQGPSFIKRSLSCSSKVFLSRYGRSRNSVLPL